MAIAPYGHKIVAVAVDEGSITGSWLNQEQLVWIFGEE
jgi:hypothetical protein